MIKVHFSAEKM